MESFWVMGSRTRGGTQVEAGAVVARAGQVEGGAAGADVAAQRGALVPARAAADHAPAPHRVRHLLQVPLRALEHLVRQRPLFIFDQNGATTAPRSPPSPGGPPRSRTPDPRQDLVKCFYCARCIVQPSRRLTGRVEHAPHSSQESPSTPFCRAARRQVTTFQAGSVGRSSA